MASFPLSGLLPFPVPFRDAPLHPSPHLQFTIPSLGSRLVRFLEVAP